jgi:hypothetical protein
MTCLTLAEAMDGGSKRVAPRLSGPWRSSAVIGASLGSAPIDRQFCGEKMGRTTASVFIIESLDFEQEKDEWLEGQILKKILKLSRKDVEYRYIRTKQELPAVLQQFKDSGMRYLHISCHGRRNALVTTLEAISVAKFGKMVSPFLKERRLFVSACEATNDNLARHVLLGSGCRSLVGPDGDVLFNDAAIVWAAFYHLMFKQDPDAMNNLAIQQALRAVSDTFSVGMRFYAPSKRDPRGFSDKVFAPDGEGESVARRRSSLRLASVGR